VPARALCGRQAAGRSGEGRRAGEIPNPKSKSSDSGCAHHMSLRLKQFTFYWLPLIFYCLAIYIQSDRPALKHIPSFEFSDKVLHFLAYAVLGILFYRAYQTLWIKKHWRMLVSLSILSASLYGLSDEIHQYFVPFRDADLLDVVANILGAICGVYLYHWWMAIKDRRQSSEIR
jgi:VanZ family protein